MQEHHLVSQRQRRGQRLRVRPQPHRIAARLHRDHDARVTHLGTQAFQRGGDRGRVMGEIVVDGDAVIAADHFHAALDAAEARQRRNHVGRRHAHSVCGSQRSQAVEHVVAAQQRPVHIAHCLPAVVYAEGAAIGGQQLGMPFQRRVEAEALDRGPAAHRQHFGQMRVLAVDDQSATRRHRAHQVVELALDRGHVREDVGVVVFKVVEDGHQRPVVHELAALVEERGVVLVGLDHELAALAQPGGDAEILGDAADQETGRTTRAFQQPGEDGGGGGLAMGTCHGQGVATRQYLFGQPLRSRNVALAGVEHGLNGGIAAREGVADHHVIGAGRHAVGAVALVQGDAQLLELGRHWRIDGLVAAADRMAQFPRQGGHAAHEGAGDCKDMYAAHDRGL